MTNMRMVEELRNAKKTGTIRVDIHIVNRNGRSLGKTVTPIAVELEDELYDVINIVHEKSKKIWREKD